MTNYTLSPTTKNFTISAPDANMIAPFEVGTGTFFRIGYAASANYGRTTTVGVGLHDAAPTWSYVAGAEIDELVRLHQADIELGIYSSLIADLLKLNASITLAYPVTLTAGVGLNAALTTALALTVMEKLFLHSAHTPTTKYGQVLAEALVLSSSLGNFFGGVITDQLRMSTTAIPLWQMISSVSDGVGLHDLLANSLVISAQVTGGLGINDDQILHAIFSGDPLVDGIVFTAGYVAPDGNFTTWAINTRSNAVSEYQNWDFASFAQRGHKFLGANATGLYELDGASDDGVNIPTLIQSGLMALGGSKFTCFKAAYLGMRTQDDTRDVFLQLVTGEGKTFTYAVTPNNMQTTRVNVGKGLRSRYWAWKLTTVAADYDLDSVEFIPLIAQRRV